MRYWIYCEPASETCVEPVWTILSDKAILAQYLGYWTQRMTQAGKSDQITDENCIQDWAATHWAVPATYASLQRIIPAPKGQ